MNVTKSIVLTILYLLIFQTSLSQTKKVDSMQKILSKQTDEQKLKTLYDLAWDLRKDHDSLATQYGLQLLALGNTLKNPKAQVDASNILGKIAKFQKRFDDAEQYFTQAVYLAELHMYQHGIARGYNELGLFYKNRKAYNSSAEMFLKSHAVFTELENKNALAKVTQNLGAIFRELEDYPKSLQYFLEHLELQKELDKTLGLAKAHRSLAMLSKDRKNYEDMLFYYQNAKNEFQKLHRDTDVFEMNVQIATAYDYLNKDEKAKAFFMETKAMISEKNIKDASNLYHNLATFYKKIGVLDSSLYYYQKAQKQFVSENDSVRLSANFNNLGNLYSALNDDAKALSNFNRSLALQRQLQDSTLMEKTYHALSEYYKDKKSFEKAFAYKDSSEYIRERLNKKIKASDRSELLYNRKNLRLLREKIAAEEAAKNAYIEASNERRNRNIIIFVSIAIIVLFFVFLRLKKLKQAKKIAELAYEQQKITALLVKEQQEKQLEEMLKEQERKAITSMISGQEEERERIAKDLHDRLGSMLSVVKIHYKSVEEDLEKIKIETKSQYEKANELLDEACEAVRKIAHNMVSGTLTKFGLVPALKELKQKIEETKKLTIELLAYGLDNRLDNTTEIQLYRIIQELLNNILKHSEATEVTIQLLKREADLNIMVSDNGIGFDTTNTQFDGMGLKSIQARLAEMNGQMLIDSGTGNGTTITIEIPT